MERLISCEFNMDTACVELKFVDGSMISIDTIAVENEVADNMYQRSELDWLIYNKPLEYAKTKILLNLEEEEARRVQSILHLSEAEVMEITHFERGNGLISTNNNNVTVEIKCSQMEKDLITTDRRELQELLSQSDGVDIA